MKRERAFCPYCGQLIAGSRRACQAHSDLPALDAQSPDAVTLPEHKERVAPDQEATLDTSRGDNHTRSIR